MTLVAITVAAFSSGGWYWTKILFTIALAVKLWAVLAFLLLRGRKRAFWIGFALFSWAVWLIANLPLLAFAEFQSFFLEFANLLRPFAEKNSHEISMDFNGQHVGTTSYERMICILFELLFGFLGGAVGYLAGRQSEEQTIVEEADDDADS